MDNRYEETAEQTDSTPLDLNSQGTFCGLLKNAHMQVQYLQESGKNQTHVTNKGAIQLQF